MSTPEIKPRSSKKTVSAPQGKTVAFQGELGAFSHSAALKILGPLASVVACPSFRDVFEKIESGEVESGILPIENTLHGSVHENYDRLLEYDFSISVETSIRISHQLIVRPGVNFRSIKRAFSHPVALNQCQRFFEKYRQIEPVPYYDTAGSVKLLKEQDLRDAAAIASETAAGIYGGNILKANIEDNRQNFTRFFLLAKQPLFSETASGDWKTSLVFSTANTPGALFRAMACFALRDLNLTKIESRPLKGKPWEYLFYVDVIGKQTDGKMKRAFAHLSEITDFIKLLGSYRSTP